MPGKLLTPQSASQEAGKAMGVYKLTFPGSSAGQDSGYGSKASSGLRNAFTGRRPHNVDYSKLAQQSMSAKTLTASSCLEAPEMEHFVAISEDDELQSNEPVFRASSAGMRRSGNMTSDDDSTLMEFASRASMRTSNVTISDDDSSLMEFASRTSTSVDVEFTAQPARHSTACCSDLAFRRELRKRLNAEHTVVENGLRRDSTSSFTLGNSFRRELEKEDRVESLALWEETDHRTQPTCNRNVVAAHNAAPHSWHAGDTAASSRTSSRNKGLDAILRKKKSSFFNGFFSGLSFSSSRKSRKSLG
ncbi:hypothetical protein KC19_4G195300 [Ceratodon purpureus]|uniref:Uncharacterized protein n=1 Tax=Ceratodon purpureus TaxID=3225 RepID=A0A8T0IE36_CERPU|nr:hypothetical protein KC19_4G195300 [Ceratodon purpureus]